MQFQVEPDFILEFYREVAKGFAVDTGNFGLANLLDELKARRAQAPELFPYRPLFQNDPADLEEFVRVTVR